MPTPVDVHLFAAARAAADTSTTSIDADSLAKALEILVERFPRLVDVLPRCSFLVDGVATHGAPGEVVLPAGCRVDVLPPFAGG